MVCGRDHKEESAVQNTNLSLRLVHKKEVIQGFLEEMLSLKKKATLRKIRRIGI
jgi:hypothetical protein